ncbi:MAG: TetR family transcriptional regulator [Actinomycetota bacterium]|nr:TetR family transcriptional regulator [Actinomycetota bacterium]
MDRHKGQRSRTRGRPPRVDRDAIAVAALELGLEHASVRAVADRLGMSVPGLYHHVQGREDIARLAVEHSQRELPLPEDTGQHWSVWLWDYACFVHDALVDDTEIIRHLLAGEIDTERAAEHRRRVVGLLRSRGFTAREAEAAFQDVQTCALGSAASPDQHQAPVRGGRRYSRPPMATLRTLLIGIGAGRGQMAAVRRALGSRGDTGA